MAEEDKDKSEQATPFKLEEARRRGQVARSVDFVSFLVVGALVAGINSWSDRMTESGVRLASRALHAGPEVLGSTTDAAAWLSSLMVEILAVVAPFLALAVLAAVLGNIVQSVPTFTAFPLKPDLQRLNPVSGFKRLFSMRALYDGIKTIVKLLALGLVAYLAIDALLPSLLTAQQADPKGYLPLMFDLASSVLFKLLLALCAIGLIDLAYNRWDFGKRMMMSRREVRDEVKRREGDPAVRARLREIQQEILKRAKSLKRVPDADVLITNPEHYAVALQYDRATMQAPCLIAKGAGLLAQEMKRTARVARVPFVENPALARRLFAGAEVGQPVPSDVFESVARVYVALHARKDVEFNLALR